MKLPIQLLWLLFLAVAVILSCKRDAAPAGITEAQVQALVTRMLAQQADAGIRSSQSRSGGGTPGDAGSTNGVDTDSTLVATPCLSAAGQTSVRQTASLLVALDELMADYRPQAPTLPERPERCLTAIAAENDPVAARTEQGHMAEVQAQRREAQQQARQTEQEFRLKRSVGYLWLSDLSIDIEFVPAVYGCFSHAGPCGVLSEWVHFRQDQCHTIFRCVQEWRIRIPAKVSQPGDPDRELLRRLQQSVSIRPGTEQFCSVIEARTVANEVILTCAGPHRDDRFRVRLPSDVGVRGAALAAVGVGDLVRFSGHTALWKKFDTREPYWEFWRFENQQVSIVERSTCCAAPPVQAVTDGGVAGAADPTAGDAAVAGEQPANGRRRRRH